MTLIIIELLLIIELLSCLSTITISFLYEGKALLLLGKENYKIKLGHFKEYNEELKISFFPVMSENVSTLKLYIDYIIFLIPGINLIYSIFKGNKKCNNIIETLKSKDIIISMNDAEKQNYNNIKNVHKKINFILFNSMDSYKKPDTEVLNIINEWDSCEKNECYSQIAADLKDYYKIKNECYEKDVSHLVSILSLQDKEEKIKVKKLKR